MQRGVGLAGSGMDSVKSQTTKRDPRAVELVFREQRFR
jgi:hypothetical protein